MASNNVGIEIVPAAGITHEVAERLLPIYLESFPPCERVPFALFRAKVEAGDWRLYLAHAGAELAGFAVLIPLAGTGADLLAYLAVSEAWRNRGIGAHFLCWLADRLRQEGRVSGLVLEVESDDAGSEAERELRLRRIGFYQRNGAVPIADVPHFYAPSASDDGLVEEKLLWLPLTAPPPEGEGLHRLLLAIYEQGYGLNEDHPLVIRQLASLPGREPGSQLGRPWNIGRVV